jgi:DNA-directed RNA polymerase specialized sigma24 family protein
MTDFSTLYQRYAGDVFRVALFLCGNRSDAEDIARAQTVIRARLLARSETTRRVRVG